MANVTDPLIRSVQGTDPQNVMEYITRQKIYDSRFWKEECFGLTVVDVLEKAARSLRCIGGTMGANQQPTKFLCLSLKLLQLQPDSEVIQDEFIKNNQHFKYVKVLGAFYLRLTGRPADIYETLESLYKEHTKIKVRDRSEWRLAYMDELIHTLLTDGYFCGITLPRLPARETLQQEGYLDEGPRLSALKEKIIKAGGLEEYLHYKVHVERSPAAMELWKTRRGADNDTSSKSNRALNDSDPDAATSTTEKGGKIEVSNASLELQIVSSKRKLDNTADPVENEREKKKKSKKGKGYGTLFKSSSTSNGHAKKESASNMQQALPEGSEEYWNEQRAKLGLKPLKN